MRLSQILRDIFVPDSRSAYKQTLAKMQENEKRLDRLSVVLDVSTERSIAEATEEAARFDEH